MTEDDVLREAHERALERRTLMSRTEDRTTTLGALVGGPKVETWREKCHVCHGSTLRIHIVDGVCESCRARTTERLEFAERQRERIPLVYREGTLEKPPEFLSAGSVEAARKWLSSSKRVLSIFGAQTGSGKSTLAACVASSATMLGKTIRWVHATDLDNEEAPRAREALDQIRTGELVVVDGIGKEFGHGRPDSFKGEDAKKCMLKVFTHIHQAKRQRFVLTFDIAENIAFGSIRRDSSGKPVFDAHGRTITENAPIYDASVRRRVMNEEFADVVTLRRNGPLRVITGGNAE